MGGNEEVVRAVLEAVNRRDTEADQPHLADDLEYVNPSVGQTDKRGWREFHTGFYAAFPDLNIRVDRLLSAGDTVVAEARVTGTHRGEFGGLPATNRAVDVPAAFIVDVADGQVKRWHTYFDAAAVLRQLGALGTSG
jgi:steroid delta-isomerase-like uncharacterized protein